MMIYLLLLGIQAFGSVFIVREGLPVFTQLLLRPGEQVPVTPFDGAAIFAVLFAMQAAYWWRLLRVSIPFSSGSLILGHVFLFISRLQFVFGTALFSIVIFRHVPELGPDIDILLVARRGTLLVISLFALFCFSLELERLGAALGETRRR